jgi:hypothetical protein
MLVTFYLRIKMKMSGTGIEPVLLAERDFKSLASTNFATLTEHEYISAKRRAAEHRTDGAHLPSASTKVDA